MVPKNLSTSCVCCHIEMFKWYWSHYEGLNLVNYCNVTGESIAACNSFQCLTQNVAICVITLKLYTEVRQNV
jgi:hypothetical protein